MRLCDFQFTIYGYKAVKFARSADVPFCLIIYIMLNLFIPTPRIDYIYSPLHCADTYLQAILMGLFFLHGICFYTVFSLLKKSFH